MFSIEWLSCYIFLGSQITPRSLPTTMQYLSLQKETEGLGMAAYTLSRRTRRMKTRLS